MILTSEPLLSFVMNPCLQGLRSKRDALQITASVLCVRRARYAWPESPGQQLAQRRGQRFSGSACTRTFMTSGHMRWFVDPRYAAMRELRARLARTFHMAAAPAALTRATCSTGSTDARTRCPTFTMAYNNFVMSCQNCHCHMSAQAFGHDIVGSVETEPEKVSLTVPRRRRKAHMWRLAPQTSFVSLRNAY
jgi:hypothetical protein